DRNRSHWSTSKTPSYTKSVSWQHHLRFRSTLTYHGMLYRMCALVVISGITGGLAYPLLKIWMIDWQAKNTYLLGDLDDLPLINKEEQPDKGFLARISRGIMPSLPFL
ncbi:hypothetical protein OFN33_18775, partial [Escherichia coli]|nr:hypothetical protein [Escherichia coli]